MQRQSESEQDTKRGFAMFESETIKVQWKNYLHLEENGK